MGTQTWTISFTVGANEACLSAPDSIINAINARMISPDHVLLTSTDHVMLTLTARPNMTMQWTKQKRPLRGRPCVVDRELSFSVQAVENIMSRPVKSRMNELNVGG